MKSYTDVLAVMFIIISSVLNEVFTSNIAMFNVFSSKSCLNSFVPVAKSLVKRGHSVTLYSLHQPDSSYYHVNKPSNVYEGINVVWLKDAHDWSVGTQTPVFGGEDASDPKDVWFGAIPWADGLCRKTLSSKVMQELRRKKGYYDILLMDTSFHDCFYPLAVEVSKVVIYISPYDTPVRVASSLNIPMPYSYVPSLGFAPYSNDMDFWERVENVYNHLFFMYLEKFHLRPVMQKAVTDEMPGLSHTIDEAEEKISFMIINQHPALSGVTPSMPGVKAIAGVHLEPAKPLPKDLAEFVNGSKDGFIYASFGTYIDTDTMPEAQKRILGETFSKLKQRVIFKFKGQLPGASSNVKLVTWAPQQDLLGHPKIRAYVSHGGVYGMQETVYHGVPVVGFPIFADQPGNIAKAVERGYAIGMSFGNMTTESLSQAINTVINDKSYKENVLKYQSWLRDAPMLPVDEAVYWVEYNIRHNGSHHLRSAADRLNIFQYFILDVVGVVALLVFISLYTVYKLMSFVLRLCCKKQNKNKKE